MHRGGVFLRRRELLKIGVSGAQRGHALGPDRGPSSGRPRAERERRVLLRPDERAAPTCGYSVDTGLGDAAAATRIRSTIPTEGVHFGFAHRFRTSSRTRGRELCATLCPSRTCSTRPRRRNGGWGVVCNVCGCVNLLSPMLVSRVSCGDGAAGRGGEMAQTGILIYQKPRRVNTAHTFTHILPAPASPPPSR